MSKEHFIFENTFWDLWSQKLFSQIISIKVWVMLGVALLRIFSFITGAEMVTIFVTVLGIKGAYEIVDVFKRKKLASGEDCAPDDEVAGEEEAVQRVLNR